jgi:hypothetical protein
MQSYLPLSKIWTAACLAVQIAVVTVMLAAVGCSDSDPRALDAANDADPLHGADAAGEDAALLDSAVAHDAAGIDSGAGQTVSDAGEGAHDAAVAVDSGVTHLPTDGGVDHPPIDGGSTDDDAGTELDAGPSDSGPMRDEDRFVRRVVTLGLEAPWEVLWGPASASFASTRRRG